MQKRRRIAIIYALLVVSISSIPGSALPKVPDAVGIDKLVHLLLFTGFGYFLSRAYDPEGKRGWLVLGFSVVYGLLDEAHQWLIPGRFPSLCDAVADSLGAALGIFWLAGVMRTREERKMQASRDAQV